MGSNHRKRIAVVIPKYGLLGGAEGHTAELTNRLALNPRYEVHVFANQWTNHPENITFHKVPMITFPKFLTTISFAYFVGIKTSQIHFDIIHTHERIFRADVCTLHGIPHQTWIRDIRKKKKYSLFDYGTIWVAKKLTESGRCHKFVAVSHLTQDKFLQEYPNIDPSHVSVIHPGVDMDAFTRLDRKTCCDEVRQQYGIDATDIVVLFVSMNYDIKGLDYLMMGLAQFKKKHPDKKFKLLIVGKSNSRKYISLAEKTGIQPDIIYTGAIPHDQIARLYLASDIFSMPSRFDTFGLTVLEAMAASLPVIISENVGAKDIVKQGINGFVINPTKHADEIADAVELLCHEDIKMKISKAAWITASHYSWEKTVEKYTDVYEEILEKGSKL